MVVDKDAIIHSHAEQDGGKADAYDVKLSKQKPGRDHAAEDSQDLEKQDPRKGGESPIKTIKSKGEE